MDLYTSNKDWDGIKGKPAKEDPAQEDPAQEEKEAA